MEFEIIPNDPKEALEWYKLKLEQIKKEINHNFLKDNYEHLEYMITLMLNYNKNIRHLKKRLKNE